MENYYISLIHDDETETNILPWPIVTNELHLYISLMKSTMNENPRLHNEKKKNKILHFDEGLYIGINILWDDRLKSYSHKPFWNTVLIFGRVNSDNIPWTYVDEDFSWLISSFEERDWKEWRRWELIPCNSIVKNVLSYYLTSLFFVSAVCIKNGITFVSLLFLLCGGGALGGVIWLYVDTSDYGAHTGAS